MMHLTVAGNLGRDAEIKQTSAGPVLEFTVASSTKRGGNETTTWVRCSMFGKRGEALSRYLTKGTSVTVVGELSAREYQDKQGQTKTSLDVRASDIKLQGGGQHRAPAPTREPGDDTDEDGYDPFR